MRHIPGRKGFVTFPLKRAECEGCSRIDALHIVGIRDQLAERVRPQKPEAGAETLLQFGLKRMIGRTPRVLIDRSKTSCSNADKAAGPGPLRERILSSVPPSLDMGLQPRSKLACPGAKLS